MVYCFLCGDYVHDETLEKILREEKAKAWRSYGMYRFSRGRPANPMLGETLDLATVDLPGGAASTYTLGGIKTLACEVEGAGYTF